MDLDESELIWSFFHQIRRVGWSIAHDQKKILLPKVVMDSGAKHHSHPIREKTPGHLSLVVGTQQNSKAVFPDVFKSSGLLRMVHEQWFDLAVPKSIGTREQCKPVLPWPVARQGGVLLHDICSVRHSLPEKASFITVKHLL